MLNDLVTPNDLAHLPGAPFTSEEVDSAVAALRNALGWHLAPEHVDTEVPFDVEPYEDTLRLPTRRLVSVQAVRTVSTGTAITGYETSRRQGVLRRSSCWPAGLESVEVDFTHGYSTCPPEMLPALGQLALSNRRDKAVRQVSVDDGSMTYGAGSAEYLLGPDLLSQYAYPKWSGAA